MGKPLDPSVTHRISRADAVAAARRHREAGPPGRRDCGAFNAKAILELLAQPGCVGLRYYHGRTDKGDPSMILVGVDADGNNMTSGILMNNEYPCPPYCPDPDDLDA